jgi:phosphoribosylglycinamide formyltransferase 1
MGDTLSQTEARHESKSRLAVLISGGGRTLDNLVSAIARGDLPARIVQVISSREDVPGNDIARRHGLPLAVLSRRQFAGTAEFSTAVFDVLDRARPELVACGGFLSLLDVPERYSGKIVNIHPSLLPLFGGRGFYGDRVHRAVLASGMKVSGCTVHVVTDAYDEGPIIAQTCVPVHNDDTIETLAARVFSAECDLYPCVIRQILDGKVSIEGRIARVSDRSR